MIPEDEDLPECSFCGWSAPDPEWLWFTTRDSDGFGNGPGTRPHTLCAFCMRSYTVSGWLAGLPARDGFDVARDMLAAMNLMRWSLLGKPLP